MKVIIMRGIPGSGKTTYIQQHHPLAEVCSADHYFTRMVEVEGGRLEPKYEFDASLLPRAHGACLRRFDDLVRGVMRHIVVDNTNISLTEIAPYAALALAYGYELEIITLEVDPWRAAVRQVHNVSGDTILRMHQNLYHHEAMFPGYWPHRVIKD